MTRRLLVTVVLTCVCATLAWPQVNVTVTINPEYNNSTQRTAIVPDFIGLGIGTVAETQNYAGVSGYLFAPSNSQLIALFQQIGIKNLRMADGPLPVNAPSHTDIDNFFGFMQAVNATALYSDHLIQASDYSQDQADAKYVWETYSPWVSFFALDNETDWHAAHTYCNDSSACSCTAAANGCSCLAADTSCTAPEGTPPKTDLVINDPQVYEISGLSGDFAGSAFPSYLAKWDDFATHISSYAPSLANMPFAGPDAGAYSPGIIQFTGTACGTSFSNAFWAQLLASCEVAENHNFFQLATEHYYVGASLGSNTAQEAIDNMLSPNWVTGTSVASEPYGTGTYSPYPWVLSNIFAPVQALGVPYRITELNDYLGGRDGASNAFAAALWALDAAHWWAFNGAAGVNFYNQQWVCTDTVFQGGYDCVSGTCPPTGCTGYVMSPKGYGLKAFNMGGHGYPVNASVSAYDGQVDAYAVVAGQDLFVTIINKLQGNGNSANVTIQLKNGSSGTAYPFWTAGVASLVMTDTSAGSPGDPTLKTGTLGGQPILNTGQQWSGEWATTGGYTGGGSGSFTVNVPAATAVVLKFRAGSNYVGPVQINQNGALELFATDSSGNVWHDWQKASGLTIEPNSAASNWNGWTEGLSGVTTPVASPAGDLAVVTNQDNTLQVFMPANSGTGTHVFYNQQKTPGGAWRGWVDMGSSSAGLKNLQAAQNADGSLSVFGLDSSGRLWTATEVAPGVQWSNWTPLPVVSGGINPGYVVGQNLNGRLEIFGVDGSANPQVQHVWQTSSNVWNSSWAPLGTPNGQILQPQIQVARNINGDLTVFAVDQSGGASGQLWEIAQNSPGGGWSSSWTALPTKASGTTIMLNPGFAVGQNASGAFEVFAVATDGNVYHVWTTTTSGTSWNSGWSNLGGAAMDPHLVVGNTNDGRLQVFGVSTSTGTNGTIYSNWQTTDGGNWNGWYSTGNNSGGIPGLRLYKGQI